jgi:hypothetical protein
MSLVSPRDARTLAKSPATEKPDLIIDNGDLPATARQPNGLFRWDSAGRNACPAYRSKTRKVRYLPARSGGLSRHREERELHA